ncbi:60S ribosomal protein L31 [Candidatus Woesearchaeota archaeon]|nr:60S ribosomal protein L31 [Candidatus Woesearchaeota archaeon]
MAKKEEASKTILERAYVIPLRRETLKVPNFKKANKAMKAVREFIMRHMKTENIVIGKYLNLKIWKHGAKNPPGKVKVNAAKDDKGKVFVEIADAPKEAKVEEKKPAKKEEKETKAEKPEDKIEKKVEEAKEEKTEEAKKIEQEEIKELQKLHPKQHAPKMPAKPRLQESRPTAPKSV